MKKTDALLGWGTGTMEKEGGGGGGRSSLLEVSDRNGWCKYQKKRRSTGDDKYIAKDLRRTSIYVPGRIFPLLFTCGIKERDNSKDCYCRGGNGSIMMEQRGCM